MVRTDDRFARAFINVRLGRIRRARSADDIRRGDLAASADGKYAHGRGIEYRRLQLVPRLGKAVRERQIELLTQNRADLEAPLRSADEATSRLHALVTTLEHANSILGTGREDWQGALRAIDEADNEIARLDDLVAMLEEELPAGLMEEKRSLEKDLQAYRDEKRNEESKERELRGQIGHRRGAMEANAETRQTAAKSLLAWIPNLDLRAVRHDPPLGLEGFVGRARSIYREKSASFTHPAQVRNYFSEQVQRHGAGPNAAP